MKARIILIIVSVACGTVACGGRTTATDGDADADADVDVDADVDGDGDGDADADADVEPSPITFRLGLVSDIPESVWVDVTEPSWTNGGHWLTILRDDEPVRKAYDCGFCLCDECGGCGICGAPIPAVEELAEGGSVEWAWNGTEHLLEACSGAASVSCLSPVVAPDGSYVARFCWGLSVEGTPPGPAEVRDVECAEIPFVIPDPDGVVEHTVNHGG